MYIPIYLYIKRGHIRDIASSVLSKYIHIHTFSRIFACSIHIQHTHILTYSHTLIISIEKKMTATLH